jgi:hypothetical protein
MSSSDEEGERLGRLLLIVGKYDGGIEREWGCYSE